MGKDFFKNKKKHLPSNPPVMNFSGILASISPLLTMDEKLIVHYANQSLLTEFKRTQADIIGFSLFHSFPMKQSDKKIFLKNLELSKTKRIQNCEFKIKEKVFGYSIFRFANEIGIILKDITETKKLQKKVFHLHSQLLKLQETERQRIARDLHDSVGQTILAAKLNFSAYEKDPSLMKECFGIGLSLIDRASQELREIYTNLFPSSLKELGLSSAIKSFLNNFTEMKQYKIHFSFLIHSKLSNEKEIHIFRITQEICTNIFKHANAKELILKFEEQKHWISILISDNGIGFDLNLEQIKSKGYGLENIKRRVEDMNGSLEIHSTPQKGTQFVIKIPLI